MRAGAIAALLALAIFILTLLWDQQLWLAAISFLVGFVAALYALWLSISLQRFYATTTHAAPFQVKSLKGSNGENSTPTGR